MATQKSEKRVKKTEMCVPHNMMHILFGMMICIVIMGVICIAWFVTKGWGKKDMRCGTGSPQFQEEMDREISTDDVMRTIHSRGTITGYCHIAGSDEWKNNTTPLRTRVQRAMDVYNDMRTDEYPTEEDICLLVFLDLYVDHVTPPGGMSQYRNAQQRQQRIAQFMDMYDFSDATHSGTHSDAEILTVFGDALLERKAREVNQ